MNTKSTTKSRVLITVVTLMSLAAPVASSLGASSPAPQAVGRVRCC